MRLLRSVLALAGLTAAGSIQAPALQMDVKGGETRCLSDSVRGGEVTYFKFKDVDMKGVLSKVKVTVRNPDGKQHRYELTAEYETHSIEKGGSGGTCRVCFQNFDQKGTLTRVELQLVEETEGSKEGPRSEVALHLQQADLLLHHAKEMSKSLKQQLSKGAELEIERISSDNSLRSRINMVAAFTILVLLAASGAQLALLNEFFRSKKLI